MRIEETGIIMQESFNLTVPIAFIIFNRLDTTMQVFETIREAKPPRLYLIADAPRPGRKDDGKKVEETRKYVEEHIDWECQLFTNYAEENMGCRNRIVSGITWALSMEEEIIILEDDVVPVPDFFRFCQEMLFRYKEDDRVMMVSGTNLIRNYNMKNAYAFSCFSSIWGWATWRRAWEKMDIDMSDWPEIAKKKTLKYVARGPAYLWIYWNFKYCYRKEIDTWDFPWDYARYKNHGLGIVPKENLVKNIGVDHVDSTHMHGETDINFTCGNIDFPIQQHPEVKRDTKYDKIYVRKNFNAWKAVALWIKKAWRYLIKKVTGNKGGGSDNER